MMCCTRYKIENQRMDEGCNVLLCIWPTWLVEFFDSAQRNVQWLLAHFCSEAQWEQDADILQRITNLFAQKKKSSAETEMFCQFYVTHGVCPVGTPVDVHFCCIYFVQERVLFSTLNANGLSICCSCYHFDFMYDVLTNCSNCKNLFFRIGRGGRFGRKGVAINFVTTDDIRTLHDIEQFYNTTIEEMPMNVADLL